MASPREDQNETSVPNRRTSPFRRKLIAAVVLVGLGLAVFATVEIAARYRENVAAITALENQVAESTAFRVRRFVADIETLMWSSAQSTAIIGTGLSERFQLELDHLLKVAPAVMEAAAVNQDGWEVAKASRRALVDDADLEDRSASIAFQRAGTGRSYRSRVSFVSGFGPHMTIAVPITWFDGHIEGVLVADVDLRDMIRVVAEATAGFGGYAYVVSDRGDLIAHPDVSLSLQGRNLSYLAQVREALAGVPIRFWPREGVRSRSTVFAAHAPIEDLGWSVIVEQPAGEIVGALVGSTTRTFLFFAAVAGMLAGVAVAMNRRVVRPLERLRDDARRIASGDVHYRVKADRHDEFADIGGSFNEMAERWDNLHATLQHQIEIRTRELSAVLLGVVGLSKAAGAVGSSTSSDRAGDIVDGGHPGTVGEAIVLLERALAEGPLSDLRLAAAMETALCTAYVMAGRAPDALNAYERAVASAEELGDESVLFHALYAIATARLSPELVRVRLDAGRRALATAERSGTSANLQVDLLIGHVVDLVEAGNLGEARAVVDGWGTVPNESDDPTVHVRSQNLRIMLDMQVGVGEEIECAIVAARDDGARGGIASARAVHGLQMFTLRREQGRLGEVRTLLEQVRADGDRVAALSSAIALLDHDLGTINVARTEFERFAAAGFENIPRDAWWIITIAHLAELCARLGDAARAGPLHQLLQRYAGHNIVTEGICLGAADRFLGLLATARGDWAASESHFEDALASQHAALQPVWRAHAQFDYACALVARRGESDKERALGLLDQASAAATKLALTKLRDECLALRFKTPGEGPLADGLTAKELRVLRLLASGDTNRSIGQKLFLSPHTVASHVRNILAKTNSANRIEAANYARRHSLVVEEMDADLHKERSA